MRSWAKRISQGIAGLCVGYFALWACAPPAAMPPPVPHAAGAMEVGAAAVGGAGLGFPRGCPAREAPCLDPYVDGMAWFLYAPGDRFAFGPVAFGGLSTLLGGGLFARYRFNRAPTYYVGAEVSLGAFWGSVSVPLSVGVSDRLWLYTRPSVSTSYYGPFHVPAGATWALGDAWRLNVEAGYRFPGNSSEYTPYEGRTVYGALGLSYGF